jgi:hypothetical protein
MLILLYYVFLIVLWIQVHKLYYNYILCYELVQQQRNVNDLYHLFLIIFDLFLVDTLFLKQCLSIFSSLGSLAYALSGYSRCWRHMQLTHSPQDWPKGKPPPQLVSWWSTIIQWVKKKLFLM